MSPRYPSTDPRVIRAALEFAETHSKNQTAQYFEINHHSIGRWLSYRAERSPEWPTDADIAEWDAGAPKRAEIRRQQQRYIYRKHRNGGPIMQPPHGTIRRLQALCAIGWTNGQLGMRLGVSRSRVSNIIRNTRQGVLPETAKAVSALYDDLWDVIPVGTGANRARAAAARKGWVSPLAWDDDAIDNPNATPLGVGPQDGACFDEQRIERRIAGDRSVKLHKGEAHEVVRRLLESGATTTQIRVIYGIKAERYLKVAEIRPGVAA